MNISQGSNCTSSCLPVARFSIVDWENDIATISGPLRLAAKYDFKALHAHATEVLKVYWPTTLSAWDEISDAISDAIKEGVPWTPINPGQLQRHVSC